MAHPAETEYLSFRDRELSNGILLVQVRAKKSCGSHLFEVGPGEADETAFVQELSKAVTSFVLRSILVKFHILTGLIESFPMPCRLWRCAQEKLHSTPVHTLSQLKHDKRLFPPLRSVVEVLSEVRLENCTQVLGVGQIWRACDSRLRKNSASHVF